MDKELEKQDQENTAAQGKENTFSTPQHTRTEYGANQRSSRPRIRVQRTYNPDKRNEGEPFRPEGFGAGLQQSSRTGGYTPRPRPEYRPRYNNSGDGQQQGYQPYRQEGYRPRYNNNGENGQQQRQPYRQSGYRPRYNNDEGATPQQGYNRRYQPSYRPRYNNNGEEGQQGYQTRQPAGYRPRFDNGGERQGGFRPRPNGYQQYGNRRPGGFQKRPHGYDSSARYNMKKRIDYNENNIDPTQPMRLNKFMANAGVCSRREADEYIQAGAITVNGEVVKELGTKVLRSDAVTLNGKPVTLEKKVYILLNKPKDCVTTSDDPQQRKTVMDIVGNVCPERIYPVGRLDRNTTGVLLLTNDGDLASKLTHPKFLKKKVYHVFLDKAVTAHDLQQIADGIELEDGEVHADAIEYADETDKTQVGIEIHSGKNRIVRRIFEHLGYRVIKLDRVLFAGLTKKNLRRGDWRYLTEKEVDMLRMGAFE